MSWLSAHSKFKFLPSSRRPHLAFSPPLAVTASLFPFSLSKSAICNERPLHYRSVSALTKGRSPGMQLLLDFCHSSACIIPPKEGTKFCPQHSSKRGGSSLVLKEAEEEVKLPVLTPLKHSEQHACVLSVSVSVSSCVWYIHLCSSHFRYW